MLTLRSVLVLGLGTGLGLGLAGRGTAQVAATARLRVRPHALTTMQPTGPAGNGALDALPGYALYVPPACAGTSRGAGTPRCPLVVVAAGIPNGDRMPQTMLGWWRPVADQYGLITLVLAPYFPVSLDSVATRQGSRGEEAGLDPRQLDTAVAQVFRRVAADPDRVALVGYVANTAAGAPQVVRDAWPLALANLDLFSRVVLSDAVTADLPLPPPVSPASPAPAAAPPAPPARFLLTTSVAEDNAPTAFGVAAAVRQQGYPAELLFSLKSGGRGVGEELDYIGQWLRDSWAGPNTGPKAVAPAPAGAGNAGAQTPAPALPPLTAEAISRLAQFWVSFQQEPDSIWRLGRRAHLRTVTLPLGRGVARPLTRLTDMAALAAQYPSVAAKLQAAGLSAAEHDAYRLALISARILRTFGDAAAASAPDSLAPEAVLRQNAAFLQALQSAPSDDDTSAGLPGFVPAGHSRYEGDGLNPDGLRPADDNWLPSGMWQTP